MNFKNSIILFFISLYFSPIAIAQDNWEQLPGLPGGHIIATAEFNSRMYAITDNHMYTSNDGQTWTEVAGQFPEATFLDLTTNEDAIWVSMNTDEKVFYSTDGETWTATNQGFEGIMFAFTLYGHNNSVYAYISDGNLYRKNSLEGNWELLSQLGSLGAVMRVHMADSLLFAYGNRTAQFGGSNFLVSSDSGRTFNAMGITDNLPFNDSFAFPSATLENFVELGDSLYAVNAYNLGTYSIHLSDSLWVKQLPQYIPDGGNPAPLPRILQHQRMGEHLIISTRLGLFETDLNYENVAPVGVNPPDGNFAYFKAFSNGSFLVNHELSGLLYLENETAEYLGNPPTGINEAGAELISSHAYLLAEYGSEIYISKNSGSSWKPITAGLNDALGFDFFGDQDGGHGFFPGNGIILCRYQLMDPDAEERIRYFATEDGGETWSKITFGADIPLDLNAGISLTKSGSNFIMTGFEIGDEYLANIYLSDDLNFEQSEQVFQTNSAFFDDISFFVEGSLLIRTTINADRERHLLISNDGGATWELKELNVDIGADFFGLTNLVDVDGTLVAFNQYGSTPEKYNVFVSEDTGTSWTLIAEGEDLFGVYHNLFEIEGSLYLVKQDGNMAALNLESLSIEELTVEGTELFGGFPTDFVKSGKVIIGYNELGFFGMNFGQPVSIEERTFTEFPQLISLYQNYPNPFNPSTMISYQLAENSEVRLDVFDMLGRKVATLVDGRVAAGSHSVNFDASGLSSGMYIYRIGAGSLTETRKMMLLK